MRVQGSTFLFVSRNSIATRPIKKNNFALISQTLFGPAATSSVACFSMGLLSEMPSQGRALHLLPGVEVRLIVPPFLEPTGAHSLPTTGDFGAQPASYGKYLHLLFQRTRAILGHAPMFRGHCWRPPDQFQESLRSEFGGGL